DPGGPTRKSNGATAAEVCDLVAVPVTSADTEAMPADLSHSARTAVEARCHVDNTSTGLNEFCSHIRRARLRSILRLVRFGMTPGRMSTIEATAFSWSF